MEFNPIQQTIWNHGIGETMIRRNKDNYEVAQWGHDCVVTNYSEPSMVKKLAALVKRYGIDGKMGMRFNFPRHMKKKIFMWGIEQNSVLVHFKPLGHRKQYLKEIPNFDMTFKTKEEVMVQLKIIHGWMINVQKEIDPLCTYSVERREREAKWKDPPQYPGTNALLVLTMGKYVGIKCENPDCEAPHYDYEENESSFHVCTMCGQIFKNSNIKHVPQRSLNENGTVNSRSLSCAPSGNQKPIKIMLSGRGRNKFITHIEERTHRERANVAINANISAICDRMRCDTGDGQNFLRKWAERNFDEYQNSLDKNRTKWTEKDEPKLQTKLKFGQWHMACVFVWYSILKYEERIHMKTVWSLSDICKNGAELQAGDTYIPNYKTEYTVHGKKRKREEGKKIRETRSVTLATVRRYAEEIRNEWTDFERFCGDIKIPSLRSIDCQRHGDMKDAVAVFVACQNKHSERIPMSGSEPWETDMVMEDGVIKLMPDPGKNGFNAGLRKGDILREVNGKSVGTTVADAYELVKSMKDKKKMKMPNGKFRASPVILTILR
jgi:hypothetical protein